mgnify:CR=1 FL=1|nr:hypothetical protein [uncultured Oscillibacter sp.]
MEDKKKAAAGPDIQRRTSGMDESEPVSIPYSYLGEIQMNLLFTKAAVGFSFISLVISLVTLLGK